MPLQSAIDPANQKLDPILKNLNDAQLQAVSASPSNLLILAGAGSGKTRVLVHRIAWLIENCNVSPYEVLAVTFTNKAANEMRSRTEQLLRTSVRNMWIGTFHGLCHRLLRIHWQEAKLPQNFEIMDSGDQIRVLKRVIKAKEIDPKKYEAAEAARFINKWKDEGQRARHVYVEDRSVASVYLAIYRSYEILCDESGLVDFAELLLRTHELWLDNRDLLAHYQRRFRHILVDEFQDTNKIQYAWLRMLAGTINHVMAVGDDDQSIYAWRGAQISNIREFQAELKDVQIIRLEQNYRSTQTILHAANTLIQKNQNRLGKTLWTVAGEGSPIQILEATDEWDEANYVADKCQAWIEEGTFAADEIAILYRNNVQSRVLEQVFSEKKIPYLIYGGIRFYDRMEVRNAMAYMKMILDPNSDVAFERTVNTPSRGIGASTMETLRRIATENDSSLWKAIEIALAEKAFSGRAANAIKAFRSLIAQLTQKSTAQSLEKVATVCIFDSGLMDFHSKEKGAGGMIRRENLEELITACSQYNPVFVVPLDELGEPIAPSESDILREFLDQATLDSGDYQATDQNAIKLMTLHSAKGLEFPVVFITGLEEDLFPHRSAQTDPDREEEERRLAYVGITRSMRQLFLSHAANRTVFGMRSRQFPSRFIGELPKELVRYVRRRDPKTSVWSTSGRGEHSSPFSPDRKNAGPRSNSGAEWVLGETVSHKTFGKGVIVDSRGDGVALQLEIEFASLGRKWFMASMANLEKET